MSDKEMQYELNETELTNQTKVISLFQFIREFNKLKQNAILNVREYPWTYMLSNLPNDSEHIHAFYRDRVQEDGSDSETDADNILLSVHKPDFQKCPEPDAIFAEWLNPGWDNFKLNASVKESITETIRNAVTVYNPSHGDNEQQEMPELLEKTIYFKDDVARVTAYEEWMVRRVEWVDRQFIIERIRNLFTDLYRLYFELQLQSETEEMIVANGILCDAENPDINHPVLTHRVKLDYNADENTVYILDTDAPSELYSMVFQAMEEVNLSGINTLREDLQSNDYHPLDRNDTPAFLKVLVHQLSSESIFSENGIPGNWSKGNRLLLYLSPCYIIRKRLDGTLKAIEQIIENVQETGEIPAPIINIVSGGKIDIPESYGEESIEEQLAAVGGESVDILLSKEANKEQLEIAQRIEHYNAVLVQGPPGTGKTHTIANLMGHFLAQGKSVLVTSHTTKALNVLKEKVAPGLQNLCVSMLDDSNADMEKSVDGITRYMSKTTSHVLKHDMDLIAVERRDIINKLADTRRKIFAIINQECNCIVYNGEDISPSQAARFISEHSDDLSYIPGKVRVRAPMPLSFEELSDLYRSNEGVTSEDEIELANNLPAPEQIMSPSLFSEYWDGLQSALRRIADISEENGLVVDNDCNDSRIHFKGDFGDFSLNYPSEDAVEELKRYARSFGKVDKWMINAAVDGKNGGAFRQRWDTLIQQIQDTCKYAESVVDEQFGLEIQFSDSENKYDLKPAFEGMKTGFSGKGKLGKLTLLIHKEYGKALESVSINGRPVSSAQECDIILHCIELDSIRRQCGVYWNNLLSSHGVPAFNDLDRQHQERIARKWILSIQNCLDWYQTAYNPLLEKLNAVGIPAEKVFDVSTLDSDITATEKILQAVEHTIPLICDVCSAVLKINRHTTAFNDIRATLLSGTRGDSWTCKALLRSIDLGDSSAYAASYADLERMYRKYALQKKRSELLKRMECIAPQWADAIRNRIGIHGQFSVPSDIEDAWKWKQYCGIIEEITEKPFGELQKESLRLSKAYRDTTARYAEKSGWYHLLRRTEADIDMKLALQGWKLTVKRIGKGTGKQAPALKAKARELMTKCQNAVPGWIMPINRALESLNPKSNRFDIIIIDEASQSDISSLAILYMGKKLIIVGDDKQVSPMAVGVEVDKISSLEQMYIKDKIPNSHLYNAKTSIYDIASTTFQPLMLREHFRCVPEIIGFSNMLSYDHKILSRYAMQAAVPFCHPLSIIVSQMATETELGKQMKPRRGL